MTKNYDVWQSNVFPDDYKPPQPQNIYDLVVIGGGTAGLVTAAGAAGLGASVALVEKQAMGGDCLNVGCVPSKALIAAAKKFSALRQGNSKSSGKKAFAEAMQQVRQKRAMISRHDSVSRFMELGVDIFLANAHFNKQGEVQAAENILRYKKAVIAVGARASAPPIPGLLQTPYLTNERLFELSERPDTLTIIGAGPIGVEMAQSFQRFGCQVQLLEVAPKILIREDQDAAKIIEQALIDDGVKIFAGAKIETISGSDSRQKVKMEFNGEKIELDSDKLLIAAGRKPNTEELGLDKVGVELTSHGTVVVDDRLRTTNAKIYSCGDVASVYQFTHAADFLARIVIQNSLFFGRKKASDLIIPWVTFSEPEIAHVGAYATELKEKNRTFSSYKMDFDQVDRAVLDDKSGFCEILANPQNGQILGATIVHEHAGDMISEITLAMQNKISLGKIASVIHPYPTQAEIVRKIGDMYNRTKLTPLAKKILSFIIKI